MNRPNILLITSDQQHHSTLGATNPLIQTPALDRLCREGTRFDRAYCPNPTCTPTRASIITGQYPSRHGAWSLGTMLSPGATTLGDLLRPLGYRSTLIGKAHFQQLYPTPEQPSIESYPLLHDLEFWRGFNGRDTPWYGFDHVEMTRNHADESHVGQHYALWMEEKGLTNWRDFFQKEVGDPGRRGAWALPEEFHYSTWTGERTCAALEQSAASQQPFFLWSSFHDPHPPYLVPEPYASMYDEADMVPGTLEAGELEGLPPITRLTQTAQSASEFERWEESGWINHGFHPHHLLQAQGRRNMALYYGMTTLMDKHIGRVLDRLDELGLRDNTLVVFTSDHGHFLGQHGLWAKGAFHYEDVLRVPFIVRHPQSQGGGGNVSNALQSLVDLAPSFLTLAGASVPLSMQGVDQDAVWRGDQESARDHALVEFHHQPTKVHLQTVVTPTHKLTAYRGEGYGEIFDLEADPQERRNLWDDTTLRARLMETMVQADLARQTAPTPRVAQA